MEDPLIQTNPEDRIILIINDTTIYGATRLQKYGFLLFKQYGKELEAITNTYPEMSFYNDWKPHYFGPYSVNLKRDLKKCVNDNTVIEVKDQYSDLNQYSLTIKGRRKWRKIFADCNAAMAEIHKKIGHLQKIRLAVLLSQVYSAYPEYTGKSLIRDQID